MAEVEVEEEKEEEEEERQRESFFRGRLFFMYARLLALA
jgi:hypothetical protein